MTPLHGVNKPELSISSRMVTKQVLGKFVSVSSAVINIIRHVFDPIDEQKLDKEPEKNTREVMETCVEGVMSSESKFHYFNQYN